MLNKKSLIAIGVLATLAASVAIGLGTIPDSSGEIHGCYSNGTGGLRVVDSPSASCKPNETALVWSHGRRGLRARPERQDSRGSAGRATATPRRSTPSYCPLARSSLRLPPSRIVAAQVLVKTVVDITSDTAISRVDCWLDEEGHTGTAGGYDSSTVSVSGDHQDVLVMSTGSRWPRPEAS